MFRYNRRRFTCGGAVGEGGGWANIVYSWRHIKCHRDAHICYVNNVSMTRQTVAMSFTTEQGVESCGNVGHPYTRNKTTCWFHPGNIYLYQGIKGPLTDVRNFPISDLHQLCTWMIPNFRTNFQTLTFLVLFQFSDFKNGVRFSQLYLFYILGSGV